MAYQWRIRHKLLLGLGLVEGLMGLLLAGTLIGLLSYHWTMKSIDSKLSELNAAETLKETVSHLASLGLDPAQVDELHKLQNAIADARQNLDAYEERLRDTLNRGRDPNEGFYEKLAVEALHACIDKLQDVMDRPPVGETGGPSAAGGLLDKHKRNVHDAITRLVEAASDLRNEINTELIRSIGASHRPYRLSMWIVLTTSGVGGLLMIGLLHFFYGWIFHPIRDLEQGVERVAQGDFGHRIELHSGDEMEELAAAFNDMTNRLDEMYRDLAHQVNERSRQLVRSERLASVGFLAAGVAHEINNPLASIAFCSEALESRLTEILEQAPAESEIINKYLRMIQQEAFRCKAITQRLLEFSRGGERRREPTDLAELIQAVLDMVQHLQNSRGKEIVFEPAGRLVAWVNAQEIKSVVLNLVINALDSMDEGGTLSITLRQHDRMAEMVFADTGCGMSSEILENIFEPFFTRSRTGKGTGLGLSISHRAISQHGGEIEAASPGLDHGSTFTVRLPLQPAESLKEETSGRAAPHKSLRVLFVDDEKSLQEFMRSELPRLGHEVTVCPDGRSALKALEKSTFDAAILDLRMPGMTGIEVLEQLKQTTPDTEAIVMTGHASMETAIEAVRLGAFDYITKPCKLAEIEAVLRKVAEKRELQHKNLALQSRVQAAEGPTVLVGKSPAMAGVHRLIATVAPTDSTVMILGETGTGKELVARTLYQQSKRADMPFVPVNCGALAENLVESELFGHRKGAFTGADRDHKGLFEVANGGTLFLDEVGELNKNIQVKLLRFLESGEIRRVGETEPFRTDVRVLCATNRDLREMIKEDQFREDLYFRINTFEIRLPPLRERRPDIPDLARHLLGRAARRPMEQVADLLSPEAIDLLLEHGWPGNVREMANVMEHAYILSGGQRITPEHLPSQLRPMPGKPPVLNLAAATAGAAVAGARTLREIEMEHVLRVLEKYGGNKPAAAAELGISLKTMYNKLNQMQEERKAAG